MIRIALIAALAWLAAAQEPPAGTPGKRGDRPNLREFLGLGPAPDAAAAKRGEPLYKQNCGTCHGETGRGSQGPNLIRSTVVLHDEKGEEIGPVITNGRPQGGMPAFPGLKEEQLYDIAEYLHLQVELTANRGTYGQTYSNLRGQTSGDPQKGQVFFQANCANCHAVTGAFAKVGAKYPQAAAMQARFLWPISGAPRTVTVKVTGGPTISGTLGKLDDFYVSLRDAGGLFHEWPRSGVEVVVEDKLTGHRALLPKYTDADLHNITAYLVTLK